MGQRKLFALLLFLFGAIAIDRGAGALLQRLHHRLDGRIANGDVKVQAVATLPPVDVLIFGDSRIRGGVDPNVIEEKTGLVSYNAAFDGRGTLFSLGLQAIRLARGNRDRCYALSVEVIDLYEPRVLRQTPLLPYLPESPVILELATAADRWAPVKALSVMWRYNSLLPEIVRRTLLPGRDLSPNGFRANHVRWDLRYLPPHSPLGRYAGSDQRPDAVDPLGERTLDALLASAQQSGITVLMFTSPMHRNQQLPLAPGALEPARIAARDWLQTYAEQKGVRYISFDEQRYPEFQNPDLYTDQMHLNAEGAALFSDRLAQVLRDTCAR